MSQDFLGALVDWWGSNSAVVATGVGTLHYGAAPGASYPYVVVKSLGGKSAGRGTGKGYWDEDHWRFTVFAGNLDQASTIGDAVSGQLDTLLATPLSFSGGYQMAFYRTGSDLLHTRRPGTSDNSYVWMASFTYLSKVGRAMP